MDTCSLHGDCNMQPACRLLTTCMQAAYARMHPAGCIRSYASCRMHNTTINDCWCRLLFCCNCRSGSHLQTSTTTFQTLIVFIFYADSKTSARALGASHTGQDTPTSLCSPTVGVVKITSLPKFKKYDLQNTT